MATVLKTVVLKGTVGSNPTLTAMYTLIVQWIVHGPSKPIIQVRFLVRVPIFNLGRWQSGRLRVTVNHIWKARWFKSIPTHHLGNQLSRQSARLLTARSGVQISHSPPFCGYRIMVVLLPSKQIVRVQFPLSTPLLGEWCNWQPRQSQKLVPCA